MSPPVPPTPLDVESAVRERGIPPYVEVPLEDAAPFACASGIVRRPPRATKGDAEVAERPAPTCGTDCC